MRREQGRVPGCYPISSSSSSQFNGLWNWQFGSKSRHDWVDEVYHSGVTGNIVGSLCSWSRRIWTFDHTELPKPFKNPYNTLDEAEEMSQKKLPKSISNLLVILSILLKRSVNLSGIVCLYACHFFPEKQKLKLITVLLLILHRSAYLWEEPCP